MKTLASRVVGVALSLTIILVASALAQVTSNVPFLPPEGSYYINPPTQPVTFTSPTLTLYGIDSIVLTDLIHTPGIVADSGTLSSGDFFDQFNSTLTGNATINLTHDGSILGLLSASGPTLVVVGNGYTPGAVGGPWETDMTLSWPAQVTWSGDPPGSPLSFYLSCSNTPGSTSVTALEGGNYSIDSYFDVQPSISFDGYTWVTADGAVPMQIAVPEPSSLALLALGIGVLLGGVPDASSAFVISQQ